MAPELFISADAQRQYMSPRDIYAFGCTILEIMMGKPPFCDLKLDGAVIYKVVNERARPPRPTEGWCPTDIWNMVTLYWLEDPSQRPGAANISAYLSGLKEGTKTGTTLLLQHLINVRATGNSLGMTETIDSLVAMGFSQDDVRRHLEQKHQEVLELGKLEDRARLEAQRLAEEASRLEARARERNARRQDGYARPSTSASGSDRSSASASNLSDVRNSESKRKIEEENLVMEERPEVEEGSQPKQSEADSPIPLGGLPSSLVQSRRPPTPPLKTKPTRQQFTFASKTRLSDGGFYAPLSHPPEISPTSLLSLESYQAPHSVRGGSAYPYGPHIYAISTPSY
ncbi:hypothetical protein L218DRAFT_570476 [Marasmius fiardii PR-910]|nr:hypothetical protein L218DRAFT_570476 [Marasmius fiardii PR-910]